MPGTERGERDKEKERQRERYRERQRETERGWMWNKSGEEDMDKDYYL